MPVRVSHDLLVACAVLKVRPAMSPAAVANPAASRVLGSAHAFPNGQGSKRVQPRRVFLGGDLTGAVTTLRRHRWGHWEETGFRNWLVPIDAMPDFRPLRD